MPCFEDRGGGAAGSFLQLPIMEPRRRIRQVSEKGNPQSNWFQKPGEQCVYLIRQAGARGAENKMGWIKGAGGVIM